MPVIYQESYGRKPSIEGYIEIVPTRQKFFEADGSDVRLDRVKVYDKTGTFLRSYLQDKMGSKFIDNQPGTEDDLEYLKTLPHIKRE